MDEHRGKDPVGVGWLGSSERWRWKGVKGLKLCPLNPGMGMDSTSSAMALTLSSSPTLRPE